MSEQRSLLLVQSGLVVENSMKKGRKFDGFTASLTFWNLSRSKEFKLNTLSIIQLECFIGLYSNS